MVEVGVENVANAVELVKMDAVTNEALAGAVISWWSRADERDEAFDGGMELTSVEGQVVYVDAALVGSAVTDAEGLAVTERLAPGSYAFAETCAPEGYELDATPQLLEVAEDGSIGGKASAVLVFKDQPSPEPQPAEAAPLVTTGDSSLRVLVAFGAAACLAAVALGCALRQRRLRRAS